MKKYYFLIAILSSVLLHAQERYFLNSDTRLYTSANTSAEFLGYFKYGAEVQLLSESKNGWYKVKADNLSEGYIPEKYVAARLNAKIGNYNVAADSLETLAEKFVETKLSSY